MTNLVEDGRSEDGRSQPAWLHEIDPYWKTPGADAYIAEVGLEVAAQPGRFASKSRWDKDLCNIQPIRRWSAIGTFITCRVGGGLYQEADQP